jgi:hypothetical protein
VWLLDLVNDAAIGITRAAGAIANIDRIVTKRWRAIITMFTCIPEFVMEVIVAITDYPSKNETFPTLVRHVLEAQLGYSADVGFIVAAWSDKMPGVAKLYWLLGFGTFLSCTGLRTGLKMVDYYEA